MIELAKSGIETRPFFYPVHVLPMYLKQDNPGYFPVADRLSARGLNLPSSANLAREEVEFVCESLKNIIS
jgi:perosamine synthetase